MWRGSPTANKNIWEGNDLRRENIGVNDNTRPNNIPEELYYMKDFIISTVRGRMDNLDMDANKDSRTPLCTVGIYWKAKSKSVKVQESSVCNLILPYYTFLHWLNYSPGSLEYQACKLKNGSRDKDEVEVGTGNVRYVKGSIWRKILCLIILVLMEIHVIGFSKLNQAQAIGHVKTMFKLILLAYLCFNLTGFRCLFSKLDDISKILNSLQQFETDFVRMGGNFSDPSKTKRIGWILVSFTVFVTLAFTCISALNIEIWLDHGFRLFLNHLSTTSVLELNLLFDLKVEFNATQLSVWTNVGIASPYVILATLYNLSWVFCFSLHLMWGIVFSWVFKVFFQLISTRKNIPRNTLEDIRKFNEITSVLENFNNVFSSSIFTGVLSGSLHFSVYVLNLFSDDQYGLAAAITVLSFSLFWIQLFASAHVNYSAQVIGVELKRRYQTAEMRRDIPSNSMYVEISQGMQVIFYELLAEKLGFQGFGFFTITYSFIGTVVSMIATYSLVVMQFKNSA